MTSPAAIVFDFDGVIVDSEPLHLQGFQQVLNEIQIDLSRELYYERYLGYKDEDAFFAVAADQGRHLSPDDVAALVRRKSALMPALLQRMDLLLPGAAECIRSFSTVAPLAVASGALRAEIELVLRTFELDGCFQLIVAAEDTRRGKPAPDPYTLALAQLNERGAIEPSRQEPRFAVAIEDSQWGIESAKAAGMRCVGVTTSFPADSLSDADLVVDDLRELTLAKLGGLVVGDR